MVKKGQSFELFEGDDVTIEVSVDGPDITGYGVEFSVYDFRGGPRLFHKTDSGPDVQVVDASTIQIELEASDTNQLQFHFEEKFYYLVRVTSTGGEQYTVTAGEILMIE